MPIDEQVEKIFEEESPTAKAVTALVDVPARSKGKDSAVETRTDLSGEQIKLHTVAQLMSMVLESREIFKSKSIIAEMINTIERKSISKDRKSRQEIVEVARQPEFPGMGGEIRKEGLVRRMFTPRA